MNLIKGLTGLRGYAAFLVYLAHMYHFNYFGIPPTVASWVAKFGPAGVSLFFVLSGFVLAINYPIARLRFRSFYFARFARIYPAYILGILLAIPLEIFSPEKQGQFLSFIANIFLIQQYFPRTSGTFNDVGWTLSVETFFYFCFPIIAVYVIRGSVRRGFAVAGLLLVGSMIWINTFVPSFYASYHFPPTRLFEFVLGMASGLAFQKFHLKPINSGALRLTLIGSIIAFFGAAAIVVEYPSLAQAPQFLFGPIGVVVIYCVASLEIQGFVSVFLASHLAVFFGEISYSFYLFHNLALRYFIHGMKIVFSQDPATWAVPLQLAAATLILIGTGIFSALVFRFIETPARRIIRTALGR